MKIFVFGNPDLDFDSLPLRILPELKKRLPKINFEIKDPNEEWDFFENELIIIDTVVGIDKPTVFDNLENFSAPPRVSAHDFDAYTNLKYLQKIGKIKKIKIIGIPPKIPEKEAIESAIKIISN
ncbi:hypothetical protein A2819_02485 [Candidatus Azambacteria bacterium RIFCSPHIGHO2_01_FULL_40_24]|uniref:Hydrogenase maturation protease n=1 Tax=Candidatus Azambacteria bacterium RIFCSPHIGHO2_01_FULL_40_24 TaxID=1797301 RepID=A0A1F5B3Q2_9BACT|nr:MAG: hypothetical protein A2819_02485 [Candidatus Azambacteria bacterium RIFCSPHIGHO2_01_FULL_40_24]